MKRLLWLPFFAGLAYWCTEHVGVSIFREQLVISIDPPHSLLSRNSVECAVILVFGFLAGVLTWRKRK